MVEHTAQKILHTVSEKVAANEDHKEGETTRAIENITARVPSVAYLGLAVGSMAASAILAFGSKKRDLANFVGLWAPCFLVLGLYNKLVKVNGSE